MDHCSHGLRGLRRVLMFPEPEDRPSCGGKPLIGVPIASAVPGDLLFPVVGVGRSLGVVLWAAVPEAAVEEDRDALSGEDHVSSAPKVRKGPGSYPVSKSEGMRGPAQGHFGTGVTAPVGLHASACSGGGSPRIGLLSHRSIMTTQAGASAEIRALSVASYTLRIDLMILCCSIRAMHPLPACIASKPGLFHAPTVASSPP